LYSRCGCVFRFPQWSDAGPVENMPLCRCTVVCHGEQAQASRCYGWRFATRDVY